MILQPNYYDKFKCIANKCKDNCCIGWEIDIDEITFNKYMKTDNKLGNRLKDEIATENGVHYFKLKDNDRCPFLNKNNLCDIICELGESGLCQICNDHPRYINNYNGITERGLGLACEEACRIILNQVAPAYLVDSNSKAKYHMITTDDSYLDYLYGIRDIIISILQNRAYKINERLACAIQLCLYVQFESNSEKSDNELLSSLSDIKVSVEGIFKQVKKNLKEGCNLSKNNIIKEILIDYTNLEILDKSWTALLEMAISNIENKTVINNSEENSCIYENMLVYLVHRYFLESYYDNMIREKALLMLSTYVVVRNIYRYSNNNIADIIHSYSKEIEYSDENIDKLYKHYYCKMLYNQNNIYTMLAE